MNHTQFLGWNDIPNRTTDPSDTYFNDHTPSVVPGYFNEAALTTKQRKELPTSEFGIPRLRAYPLNDPSHVRQAMRMYHHCKDPKDKVTLMANIKKAGKKHGVDTSEFEKKNSPKTSVVESTGVHAEIDKHLTGSTNRNSGILLESSDEKKLSDRTREDIIEEHLRVNGSFYNNVFYGSGYLESLKQFQTFKFLDFFYPNFTRMSFPIRLLCCCGQLGIGEGAEAIYPKIHMRSPMSVDMTEKIGWCTSDDIQDDIESWIHMNYMSESNWFKVDLSDDIQHIFFCIRLYSIMGKMMLDPNFDPDIHFTEEHQAVLMDWNTLVHYHLGLYRDAQDEKTAMKERQYLWDLFWNFTDNPDDPSIQVANAISMIGNMAITNHYVQGLSESNVPGELVSKEQCNAYLVHDINVPEDFYLLPEKLEYPIIDKASVKMAMDNILRVDQEDRPEYAKNLNRKYREMGCTFSISVDHPYAKYADKAIILRMTHFLLEGDTAVSDDGTSAAGDPVDRVAAPPHKKVEFIRGQFLKNLADQKLTQPNVKSTVYAKDMDDSLT